MFGTRKTEKEPFGARICHWMMDKMKAKCPCAEDMAKAMEAEGDHPNCAEFAAHCCGTAPDTNETTPEA
jgi:hypothetical protein